VSQQPDVDLLQGPAPYAIVDLATFRLVSANERFTAMLGVEPDAVEGTELLGLMTGRQAPLCSPAMRIRGQLRRLPVLLVTLLLAGCESSGGAVAPKGAPSGSTAAGTTASPSPGRGRTPLLGAYYYSWFPENLAQGTLGPHLVPPRGPGIAYRSDDPRVAERSIAEASAAGLDFFALDWWPTRPELNRRIDDGFLRASNLASMHFAIFYETGDLGVHQPYNSVTELTPAARAHLVADMVKIATTYFADPQYLRVGGRPVVFWYVTRTLTGDVAAAVAAVRTALRARGFDAFIVGDEISWRVTTEAGVGTTAPQPARARLFDAITWYNLYDTSNPAGWGYGSATTFVADVAGLATTYRDSVGGAVPIVPAVIPGYNDRGARLGEAHGAIPRQWAPGETGATFLQHMLDQVALPNIDPRAPMLMVTSWNEWNEDTAIEPVTSSASTTQDDSPSGTAYTQGYRYGGPGSPELDVLRSVASARH